MQSYSNRPDLLKRLRKARSITAEQPAEDRPAAPCPLRSHKLRDRFSAEELDAMVAAFVGGATSDQIAAGAGVCGRTVRRLLRRRGVTRHSRTRAA